jgi:lysozyme family protein
MPHDYTLTALAPEYERLFDTCKIDPKKSEQVEHTITSILQNGRVYTAVSESTGVPWWFVGILHGLEASFSFNTHLHNGDSLSMRTVHVPKGRPVDGQPPFQWRDSAIDALRYQRLDKWTNWTAVGALHRFEAWNGWGYRQHGVNSAYLWSGSQQYTCGKFIEDGVWSTGAVSKQIGAAVILRSMFDQHLVEFPKAQ